MTSQPKTVGSGDSLADVVRLFLEKGITSSPVMNPLGEILGILTELTLVKAFILHKASLTSSDRVGHHIDLLEPAVYVEDWRTLTEVMKAMVSSPTHRLLVHDANKKVIGIISPKDLMKAFVGLPTENLALKLRQTEERLLESLHELENLQKHLDVYKNIFHEVPYVLHAVDEKGTIIMSNKREHEMLGYKDGELIGRSIFELYAEPMHEAASRGLKNIIEGGHQAVTYTSLRHKNGHMVRCDIASSSLRDRNGKFLSTVSVLRPIDSDELMRILNGITNDSGDGSLAKYVDLLKSKKA